MFHLFRECNRIANLLANIGCIDRKFLLHAQWEELVQILRGVLNLDRLGRPNLRCKKF